MKSELRLPESSAARTIPFLLVALGVAAAGYGLISDPQRTWPNLLVDGFYATTLPLSAIFFLAVARLTGARWSAGLRRVPEAFMLALPVFAVLLLAVWVGRETLYPWSRPGAFAHESAIAGKVKYLQTPFVLARMAVALGLWTLFAWLFRRASLRQDRTPQAALIEHRRLNRLAVFFVWVFALTLTTGGYDWLISMDPSWFSTMFGVYIFIGTFVQGIAAVTLAVVLLKQRGHLGGVAGEHQLHDLGKMLFAFSTFWAYIWTGQYLLIWYGDIPEEVTHYLARTNGGWLPLYALNFLMNWIVPFTVLMSARAKCTPRVLKTVCTVLLLGHWLDLYLVVTPSVWPGPRFGVTEIVLAAGYGSLLLVLFLRNLSKAPLVPRHDPVLAADQMIASRLHHQGGEHA